MEQRFRSNPLFEGNLNKVTMGYLILGQNQKVDSIRQVVINEFPNKKIGLSYRLNKLFREQDSSAVVAKIGSFFRSKRPITRRPMAALTNIFLPTMCGMATVYRPGNICR
ncbi:hypothetical protein KUH03_01475 [Sphingobacterium sp. E70]|uniref:hypothetical protein n=1 Tax=Sphingobacterium sp. E70 TaxID=2853439 RepID=UPI00211BF229|nr:hypothetical protein [Sphingobacterium sp. E70]ULT25703.1 hypothetical protein KUH03_01475 [Sphingobacterium sp. E70]